MRVYKAGPVDYLRFRLRDFALLISLPERFRPFALGILKLRESDG